MDHSGRVEFECWVDRGDGCIGTRHIPWIEQRQVALDDIVEPISTGDFLHLDYR